MKDLNVKSEIGRLKKVLLHRPGAEIENLTPDLLERLLFDDIPYLKVAREEHDAFAKALKDEGVEIFYIEELTAEALKDSDVKEEFIDQFLKEAGVESKKLHDALKVYLMAMDEKEMVDKTIAGIRTFEIDIDPNTIDNFNTEHVFYTDPLPNLLFQRDPFATMGNGISLNKMRTETRNRETIYADYVFKYHPDFRENNVPRYYDRHNEWAIEGGDQLVLNEKTLAIGISERTDFEAIKQLAEKVFYEYDTTFETILAFDIPKKRAFMHLDTVFTQIDYDKFTIHSGILGPLTLHEIIKGEDGIEILDVTDTLEHILSKHVGHDVKLIKCGGGDPIASAREQWNDGANTLAVAPGVVVVYSRNWVTNELLRQEGIKVIEIPSSELSRGRGGPRCMSMPLEREDI